VKRCQCALHLLVWCIVMLTVLRFWTKQINNNLRRGSLGGQTAFRSVHPFLHGSRSWPVHYTGRPRYTASTAIVRITLCMRCSLEVTLINRTSHWWYIEPVVVGNVGDNGVSSYRLHAYETQQLADATPICYLCGAARGAAVNQRRADLQHATLATQRLRYPVSQKNKTPNSCP